MGLAGTVRRDVLVMMSPDPRERVPRHRLDTRGQGYLGNLSTWLRSYMATWLHGYMATWLHGYMATGVRLSAASSSSCTCIYVDRCGGYGGPVPMSSVVRSLCVVAQCEGSQARP